MGQTRDGHGPPMTKAVAQAGLDLGFRVRAHPPALGRNQEEVAREESSPGIEKCS